MAATTSPMPSRHPLLRKAAAALPGLFVQVGLVAVLFLLYRLGRTLAGDDVSRALQNGTQLWHFERNLNIPSEETLQKLVLSDDQLVRAANWYYVGAHFPVTIAFLLGLFVFARRHYARARNAMAAATALGLGIHIFYPLAPPRLVSGIGMVDTGHVFGPSPYQGAVRGAANQFAAMPSLHVGWAVLVAIVLWQVLPRLWRWIGVLHAVLTTMVVVVTANHYWIDGVVGTVIVLMALRLTRPRRVRLARLRAGELVIDLRDGHLSDRSGEPDPAAADEPRRGDAAHVA
jgi:hypothetical protein